MALDRSTDARQARVKLEDVAARAGVSAGTVSNALNHPDKVAPATRERVVRAIAELGFTPNGAASALASGSTKTVGLVVVDLMNSLFVDLARGAQRAARGLGYDLQLADSDNDLELEASHLDFLSAARVAGVLLAPMHTPHESIVKLRQRGSSIVMLNYESDTDQFCTVLIDNERAGYIAARHLIGLGRKRIAFVGGLHHLQPVALRRAGARRAVAEADGAVELIEIDTVDLNPPSGAIVGKRLVEQPESERPDAILAVTDLLAMAIISEFTAARLRVPEDVAVMGCDHNSAAWGGAVPLTSVTMRGREMGTIGVELLKREISEPAEVHLHQTVTLEPALVVRESTVGRG
ncbi:LacI family DNA-binding transcriptional regulator [Leifsonia poae]|uniref:Transcriptional regulator n=1 Tax=Leifsonia poae TaxID=110933 RepID=A0A9W6H7X5_9MICO|nr:LacI family DNA-binding transcriptional regulator [Leifsonia poae]GLJ75206.1 transcriptional regulator [Leifsonia poae]